MAHLTQLWSNKLKNIREQGRANNGHHIDKRYMVRWDDPQYGQGEKVTEELFTTHQEALDYAISIGLKYDLRMRNGKFHQADPNLSRFKSGYSELPQISAIPALWPSVLIYGATPTEISEDAITLYCEKHGISKEDRPDWSLPVTERAEQIKGSPPQERTKAGPLSFDDMISKRIR